MRFKLKIIFFWFRLLIRGKFRNAKSLEDFQEKQWNRFVKKVLLHSEYYKPFIKNGNINPQELPLMEKAQFMASFNQINTCGLTLDEAMQTALEAEKTRDFKSEINGITVGLSTGTSGKRGLFLVSENERAQWVALVMQRVIQPKFGKRQKVAFFLRANSNLYSSVQSALFEFQYFDIFKKQEELFKELQLFQPHILASQPSYLLDIAEAQKRGNIHIQPKQLISFAEVLTKEDKEIIQSIFPVQFSEVYQCTEGFLGCTCKHGTMHLNEDLVKIEKEWIDEHKFFPIITDFSRSSQPIIKYKLNDILEIKKDKCPCGSAFLAINKIIGREDDVLIFSGIKVYPDLLSRRIALMNDEFYRYTIIQTNSHELEISIETDEAIFHETCESFKSCINSYLTELGISGISFKFKQKIEQIPGNKLRKIKRMNHENKHIGH